MICERDWKTWFNTYDTNKSEQISVLQKREMPRFYSEDWAAHRAVNLGQPLQHKRNKRSWKCISRSRKYQQVHVHSAACTCICTPFSVSPSLPLSLALLSLSSSTAHTYGETMALLTYWAWRNLDVEKVGAELTLKIDPHTYTQEDSISAFASKLFFSAYMSRVWGCTYCMCVCESVGEYVIFDTRHWKESRNEKSAR